MKTTLLTILLLVFTWPALAQAPILSTPPETVAVPLPMKVAGPPATVAEIEGPTVVVSGQPVQFTVTGFTTDQLAEIDMTWFPRRGVTCILATTWPDQNVIIWFVPGKAPEYLVKLHARNGVSAEIVVSTDGIPVPPPDPAPNPVPPPTPGERLVIVVHESEATTAKLAQNLETLRQYGAAEPKILRVRILDQDYKGPDDKTPEWFQSYLDLIEKKKLKVPVLMVGVLPTKDGEPLSAIYVEPLPDTAEEIIAAVKKYGG